MNGTDGKPFKTREGGVLKLNDLIEMTRTASCPSRSFSSVGNSLTHGAHQLAHRLTSTGTPLNLAILMSPPSGFLNITAGAASPLWLRSTPLPVAAGDASLTACA